MIYAYDGAHTHTLSLADSAYELSRCGAYVHALGTHERAFAAAGVFPACVCAMCVCVSNVSSASSPQGLVRPLLGKPERKMRLVWLPWLVR